MSKTLRPGPLLVLHGLLYLSIVCAVVPFFPDMPKPGLDPSWAFAINAAVAKKLVFGRDIVFTFGPYASVYTTSYHPETDRLMLWGSAWIALAYAAGAGRIVRGAGWKSVAALLVTMSLLTYSRDALLFAYPLLVGLVCFGLMESGQGGKSRAADAVLVALLFSVLGLLPLIKGSFLALSGLLIVLTFAQFVLNGRRQLAVACVLSPIAACSAFWALAGQHLPDLPGYFASMLPMIAGYNEAMSREGSPVEIALFVTAGALLLVGIARQGFASPGNGFYLFVVAAASIFVAFKAGYVRHDASHSMIAANAILIFGVLLLAALVREAAPATCLGAAGAIGVVLFASIAPAYKADTSAHKQALAAKGVDVAQAEGASGLGKTLFLFQHLSLSQFAEAAVRSLTLHVHPAAAWRGIAERLLGRDRFDRAYVESLGRLRSELVLSRLPGTTDIYSHDQSYLLASGNDWAPRPVVQSYAAFTPELLEANRRHLAGERSPGNVIFSVQPIDRRLPSLEDGASWPLLVRDYAPVSLAGPYLLLGKRRIAGRLQIEPLASSVRTMGEPVVVPDGAQPILLELKFDKTVLGRLADFFYKPSELWLTVDLANGARRTYRIASRMSESGFLLSPLIENAGEFGLLYRGGAALAGKVVRSFTVSTQGSRSHWNDEFRVVFKRLDVR